MPNMSYYGLANIKLSTLEQPLEVTVNLTTESDDLPNGSSLLSWGGKIINPAPFMKKHFINSMPDTMIITLPNGNQGHAYIIEIDDRMHPVEITSRGDYGIDASHYRQYAPGRTSFEVMISGTGKAPYAED